jgi:hypothetical protein
MILRKLPIPAAMICLMISVASAEPTTPVAEPAAAKRWTTCRRPDRARPELRFHAKVRPAAST